MNSSRDSNDVYGSQAGSTTINHTETQQSTATATVKYDTTNTPINKGTDATNQNDHNEPQQDKLLFFNYHEYMVNNYTDLRTGFHDIHDQAIVITHFPNYSVPEDSELNKETRIVRIPRIFGVKGIVYPEYSTLLPGNEAAAIQESIGGESNENDDLIKEFIPKGIYEGQLFGTTSISPLSKYFDEDEFTELMTMINSKIRNCYSSYHFWNILEFLLDMLTFWLLSDIFKFQSKRLLDELEQFIVETNKDLEPRGVKIISPRRTAYLSIDFQILKPTL